MTDPEKKHLSDILQSIQLIESFTSDISDFNIYINDDQRTQSTIERQFRILGEVVNRFDKSNKNHSFCMT
jgi:uncharacterized protein with HEPN domain